MTVSSGSPAILPPTIESWVAADRALDAGRMRDLMAPAIVLASPLTDAFDFTGPDDVAAVFAAAFEVLDDVDVARVTGAGADWAVHATNTVNGRRLEEIQWLHLGDDGLVDRITMFMRPLASTVELLAAIGPALARRGLMSPGPAKAASALARMPAMQLHLAEKQVMPRLRPRD